VTAGLTLSVTPPTVTLSMLVRPVPLSEIQNGLVGLYATPHGLIRLGSVRSAGTDPSEIRLVCVKVVCAIWRGTSGCTTKSSLRNLDIESRPERAAKYSILRRPMNARRIRLRGHPWVTPS
jgi:hypothetical protein